MDLREKKYLDYIMQLEVIALAMKEILKRSK
jgi:hypothetical protein